MRKMHMTYTTISSTPTSVEISGSKIDTLMVISVDIHSAVYFTAHPGSTATINGEDNHIVVGMGGTAMIDLEDPRDDVTVSLVSPDTGVVMVCGMDGR
jgi:hypothetical protein